MAMSTTMSGRLVVRRKCCVGTVPTDERIVMVDEQRVLAANLVKTRISTPVKNPELRAEYTSALLGPTWGDGRILPKSPWSAAMPPGVTHSLTTLRTLVDNRDRALLAAVAGFDDRHYAKLADELLTLHHNQGVLLNQGAEGVRRVGIGKIIETRPAEGPRTGLHRGHEAAPRAQCHHRHSPTSNFFGSEAFVSLLAGSN
jgi:hypothetical protein